MTQKLIDQITGKGLIAAGTQAAAIRRRLLDAIATYRLTHSQSEILQFAFDLLKEWEPYLTNNLASTQLAAFIFGADKIAQQLPPNKVEQFKAVHAGGGGSPPKLRLHNPDDGRERIRFPAIDTAVDSLFSRQVMTRDKYDLLSDRLRSQAFTVAGDITDDTILSIRDVLAETMASDDQMSLTQFRENLGQGLRGSFISESHLENVYRTNAQTAYSDGQQAVLNHPIVNSVFPYLEYIATHDARTEENHLALETLGLDGTGIYRRDDPMWNWFMPPWRFQCRCSTRALTIRRAADAGVQEANEWLASGNPPAYPEWRVDAIPFRPAPGWGHRERVSLV